MNRKWIMIADGAKASFYSYEGPHNKLAPVDGGCLQHVNKPSRELVTTKRGRMPDNGPGQCSALERPTDPHEHEKYLFARKLAAFLEKRLDEFDMLIIAASPNVLGDIRQLLPETVKAKVSSELNKNLTNIPPTELPRHLQDVLNIAPNSRHIPKETRHAKH